MDRFMEEVVVKKQRGLNELLFVLSMIAMVVLGLIAMFLLQMLFMQFSIPLLVITLLSAGGAVLLFLFRDRLRTEYEYTFTNGDVDFAQVYNNQKRKSLGSLKVNKVDAFGPVSGSSFQRYVTMNGIKRNNWFLNRGANLYYFYFQKDNNKRIIIFEPSEEMVNFIKFYLPRGAWQE